MIKTLSASDQLQLLNHNILSIKKHISKTKKDNQIVVLRSKIPLDFDVLYGDHNQIDKHILSEFLNKKDILMRYQESILKLNQTYPSNFTCTLDFLFFDISLIINNHMGNVAKLIGCGLNVELILLILKYIDDICNQIDCFFKKYVFRDYVTWVRWPVETRCDVDISNIYNSVYNQGSQECTFEMMKYYSKHMFPFYQSNITPEMMIPDHRRMMSQKSKEIKISVSNMKKNDRFIFNLFKGEMNILHGYLYDYIIYNPNNKKTVVLFIFIAKLLQFGIDNVMKRRYTFAYNKVEKTISLSSTICNYDAIPEISVDFLNINIEVLLSSNGGMITKTIFLNDFINKNDNNFEFRNFKSHNEGSFCMIIDDSKFNYDNKKNLITTNPDDFIEAISFNFDNRSRDINENAPMVIFSNESNQSNIKKFMFVPESRSAFVNQKCNVIDENFSSSPLEEYNDQMNRCINIFEKMSSKSQCFQCVFNGLIININNDGRSKAQLLVDVHVSPSNSKKYYLKINKLSIHVFNPDFLL